MLSWLSGFKGWLYAGLAAAIVGAGLWAYWHGREVGTRITTARYEKLLTDARNAALDIEDSYKQINEDHSHELDAMRSDRDAAYAAARHNIQPVRLQVRPCPAVPSIADPAGPADTANPEAQLPVRMGENNSAAADMPDIGPDSLELMRQCQQDNDEAVGWDEWWAKVSAVR